jgi:hypothetical protein
VLVHVVGGAHNEALTVLVTLAGVALWLGGREAGGVAVATVAAAIKASAAIVLPFLVLARPPRLKLALVAAATTGAVALLATAAFGTEALDALSLINSNQDRSSRFSLPHKAAQLLGGVLPGGRSDHRNTMRVVFAVGFAIVLAWLLWCTWRGTIAVIDAIGWAALAILLASTWLVPWYILWVLPFAALSRDRRLQLATLALTAWMLAISVPF